MHRMGLIFLARQRYCSVRARAIRGKKRSQRERFCSFVHFEAQIAVLDLL